MALNAARIPCLAIGLAVLAGCPAPQERTVSATTGVWDGTLAGGFWSAPFPADWRVTDSGAPDLADYPNPGQAELVQGYIDWALRDLRGFGLSAPIWLPFDGEVALPEVTAATVAASARCEGPLRLVDVDPDSPDRGRCVPLRWLFVDELLSDPFIAPNVVALAPAWGFPLRSDTTYAAFVADAQDPAGDWLQGDAALRDALQGQGARADELAPLRAALDDFAALGPEDRAWISAATVFTTQDVHLEMQALADFVRADTELPAWDGALIPSEPDDPGATNDYRTWSGAYTAWNFSRGEIPYRSEGGGFVWDAGVPVPQVQERIPFFVSAPLDSFEQPEAGWPVVLHGHGTFGDERSHFGGSGFVPAELLARRGFVNIGIPQPIHGDRWAEGTDLALQLYAFNYFNPESGTSMFRQAAIDTIALVEFVRREMAQGGALATAEPGLRIDPTRIYYVGHSQGGITGALAIAYDEHIRGWVLSGAGGGLSMTVLQRTDPLDIQDLIVTAIGAGDDVSLYELHPVIGLVQMLVERTDPLSHAPRWFHGRPPTSVLLTEGIDDTETPADVTEAMAVAAGLSPTRGYVVRDVPGMALRGLTPLGTPYRDNRDADGVPVTAGLAQFDADHFAIFRDASAASLFANFLWSAERDDATPQVGASFP